MIVSEQFGAMTERRQGSADSSTTQPGMSDDPALEQDLVLEDEESYNYGTQEAEEGYGYGEEGQEADDNYETWDGEEGRSQEYDTQVVEKGDGKKGCYSGN